LRDWTQLPDGDGRLDREALATLRTLYLLETVDGALTWSAPALEQRLGGWALLSFHWPPGAGAPKGWAARALVRLAPAVGGTVPRWQRQLLAGVFAGDGSVPSYAANLVTFSISAALDEEPLLQWVQGLLGMGRIRPGVGNSYTFEVSGRPPVALVVAA